MPGTLKLSFRKPMPFRRYYDMHIAKGALFIPTRETLPVMARVRVLLDLAFCGEKLELDGEVVECVAGEGPDAGIALQLLDPVAKLRERLEALLPASDPAPAPSAPAARAANAPVAPARPKAGGLPADAGDLDISDDELDDLLAAEGGEVELPLEAPAPAGIEDPDDIPPEALMAEAPSSELPPGDDPEAIDPTALSLSPDDPEPTPAESLPVEGPYDPSERTIAD